MKKNKKRRKNPFQFSSQDLLQFAGSAMDMLITQELRGMTVEQKTLFLALLPQLKRIIQSIPKNKLSEMTPETVITIH